MNGITLIALIITIIVLLILAGVSINMVLGDNGIITKAQSANAKTTQSQIKENIEIAWAAIEIEYYDGLNQDSTYSRSDFYTETNLNKNLVQGKISELNYVEDGISTLKYTDENDNLFKYAVDSSGKIIEVKTLYSQITADNYGDSVNYTANGISDWKIFYSDDENIYLISSDYMPNTCVSESYFGKTSVYNIFWKIDNTDLNNLTIDDIDNNTLSKVLIDTNYLSKYVISLLKTETWNNFANNTAEFAIGSPTVEMFIASWNNKYPASKLYYFKGEKGYSIWTSELTEEYYPKTLERAWCMITPTEMQELIGGVDELYFPNVEDKGIVGYWLTGASKVGTELKTKSRRFF
jgi:hypothetical protein